MNAFKSPLASLRSSRGSALIGAIVATSIVLAVAVGIAQQQMSRVRAHKAQIVRPVALAIRDRLLSILNQKEAWATTVERNPDAFAAAEAAPGGQIQLVGQAPLLDLYLANSNEAYYRSSDLHSGFDLSGRPCRGTTNTSGGATGGEGVCPFYFKVRLRSRYQVAGNWVERIRIDLDFRGGQNLGTFNPDTNEFHFDFIRGATDENGPAKLCISAGGSYNNENSVCSISFSQVTTCEQTEVYVGASTTGAVGKCAVLGLEHVCAGNQVVVDFDELGKPICRDMPTAN